tara:strand:+ start:358 stop:789 length:432 start_codon:yes stop_codon:yes gene_type:complete
MKDKINRANKPIATQGKLIYGRGDVIFQTNGEVAAFEIDYSGLIQGVKKLGDGWTIRFGKNKIIIFSLAQTELSELLFTYVGDLEISKCNFVTWNNKSHSASVVFEGRSSWRVNRGSWGSDARKYEEIKDPSLPQATVRKSTI